MSCVMALHFSYVDPSPKGMSLRHVFMREDNYSAYYNGVLASYGTNIFLRIIWKPDADSWFNQAVNAGIVFG